MAGQSEGASLRKAGIRATHRAWVGHLIESQGTTPSRFAKLAGIDRATVSRLLSDDHDNVLMPTTIARIEDAYGLTLGAFLESQPGSARTAIKPARRPADQVEATPFAANDDVELAAIERAISSSSNAIAPFELKTDALASLGYRVGDILIVDVNAEPADGDVVCVQLYDWHGNATETVFRLLTSPYLVLPVPTATPGAAARPIRMDDGKVGIKGPVTRMLRPRRLSQVGL